MPYAVQDDLAPARLTVTELAELTNDGGGQEADAALVTRMLTEASAMIDSYCRQRYSVPLQASDQLKSLAVSIALYKLFLRRRRVDDSVRQEYEDAIAFLKDVANGKAGLDQPAASTPQAAGGAVKATQVPEKFSDDNLKGFV